MPRSICTVEDCGAYTVGRGLCRKHYSRKYRHGTTDLPPVTETPPCVVDGCDAGGRRRQGYCDKHYRRLLRHGDPNHLDRVRNSGTFAERLKARAQVEENGCWTWMGQYGGRKRGPRPQFYDPDTNRTRSASRLSYETFIGPIPDGLELDHLCVNPACVNPEHLEPVTGEENRRRYAEHRRRQI